MKADNPDEAIEEFLGMPALEQDKGDWGFKGLKQAVKLEYKLAKYDEVRDSRISSFTNAYLNLGYQTLYGTSYLRQVCRDTQLLRKINQQYARLP